MLRFCVALDSAYLVRAVALHRSLARHCDSFSITACCLDERSRSFFERLELPGLEAISVEELEGFDPRLAEVRAGRTPAEYSWTVKGPLIQWVLDAHPDAELASYLDTDMLFFSDPAPIYEEMGGDSVLIVPHAFAPEYAGFSRYGEYNAGFISFRRDERGRRALDWWRDRCIEWCHAGIHGERSGDQKYLDDWTERFDGVHPLQHRGATLAPWNVGRYRIEPGDRGPVVDGEPVVLYHFHKFTVRADGRHGWRPPGYRISAQVRDLIYRPYMAEIDAAIARLRELEPGFADGMTAHTPLRDRLSGAWRTIASRPRSQVPAG